jgi:hypothetical protein
MSNSREPTRFTFGGPADYRVVVQGGIDASASDRLGGMQIETISDGSGAPVTTLIGRLKDQAHLAAVLNTIHQMHLAVLEVKKLNDE